MKLLPLILCLLIAPLPAAADIVRYTDEEGREHYVDSPEKVPEQYRDQLKGAEPLPPLQRVKSARKELYEKNRYTTTSSAQRIELFVADWCPYCKSLEQFLKSKNVPYTRYDIDRDKKSRAFVASLGGGIPVTKVGTQVIQGYNPQAILKAAGIK